MKRREFLAAAATMTAAAHATIASAHIGGHLDDEGKDMITRKIPSSGEALPVIGLGTSGPFEVGMEDSARAPLREVLQAFFASGATVIDTSPMYSTAEAVLGDLLTPAQQERAFIATKVWTPKSSGNAATLGVEQMTNSMRLLRRERVELMQVHNLVDLDAHLATLRRWQDAGKIKYIGITHFTVASYPQLIDIIQRERLDFVQFNYSAVTREAEQRLLPLCADKGVAVLVNRAFEDGKLFERVRGKPVPDWAEEFDATTWAQVFLKYVLANPAVTCVIPATGKLRNMRDNLAAGLGELPDAAQRARIVAALA
ncbi:MAG TPA: aldo/keto reductase [Steroidobacteraceae bacterium]|nr:aldo/keto reductase [Steroidobacteraceae bacterium]HRX90164.1 aldo/keto reductase [Steroidobacteraceae bacterium]